jgi:hypothetical protein
MRSTLVRTPIDLIPSGSAVNANCSPSLFERSCERLGEGRGRRAGNLIGGGNGEDHSIGVRNKLETHLANLALDIVRLVACRGSSREGEVRQYRSGPW